MLKKKYLDDFMENGFIEFSNLLDVQKCNELHNKILFTKRLGAKYI